MVNKVFQNILKRIPLTRYFINDAVSVLNSSPITVRYLSVADRDLRSFFFYFQSSLTNRSRLTWMTMTTFSHAGILLLEYYHNLVIYQTNYEISPKYS